MANENQALETAGETPKPAGAPPARIFVALKIAPQIAGELAQVARVLERFAVRPIAPADIHLTLVPPWNEVSIPDAVEKLRAVADRCKPFTLTIQHVAYGPQKRRPHLLWAECAVGEELTELHAALLLAFGQTDERPFRPHVTLARIRGNGARIARRQPIDQDLTLTQRIVTVELMQSPPPGAHGYKVLASLRLAAPEAT
jgi:2'-5' RNA ligase